MYLIPYIAKFYMNDDPIPPTFMLFALGATISTALIWKNPSFTKWEKKLSLIPFALIIGCSTLYLPNSGSDLNKDVYVPEAEGLQEVYYHSIAGDAGHQLKSKKELSLKQIYNMYSPAVVVVEGKDKDGELFSAGTGFIISEDGVILTNFHVLRNAYAATVKLPDQSQYQAFVFAKNKEMDFAILKIKGNKLPYVVLGNSDTAEVGDVVSTIGNPGSLENSFANGIVSGVNQKWDGRIWLHTSISVAPGSSGGPVFNSYGEVIGIMAILTNENHTGLAIPINQVLQLMAKKADK